MKKGELITSIVFFVVGVIIILAVAGSVGFDYSEIDFKGEYVVENKLEFDREINEVDIRTEIGNIIIKSGDTPSVVTNNAKHHQYEVTQDANGKLTVVGKFDNWFYKVFGWLTASKSYCEITLPGEWGVPIAVDSKNSNVLINNISASSLDIFTTNGKIDMQYVTTGNATVVTTNGNMTVADSQFTALSIRSTNGKIKINNTGADSVVTAKTTNGQIFVCDVDGEEMSLITTNGSINAENMSSTRLTMTSTNGKLSFQSVIADYMTLKTTNGDIAGQIIGTLSEYTITARTTNGHVSHENQTGTTDKALTASSTNGDIELTFSA